MLVLIFLAGFLCVVLKIQKAESLDYIRIKADGSVFPSFAPILSVDNVTYTFTDDVTNGSVLVERNNILVNGAGHTIQGPGDGLSSGLILRNRENVTVMNLKIKAFYFGVDIERSSNVFIYGNNITANVDGISIFNCPKSNTFSGNYITDNSYCGIYLYESSNQVFCENVINNNTDYGMLFLSSSNHILYGNVISNSALCLCIWGDELHYFVHSIDVSNLVNGQPVYYFVNQTDLVLTNVTHPQVGYLALVNCTNMTIEGLSLANTAPALILAYTSNSTIIDNSMTDTIITNESGWCGLLLKSSCNNTFVGNNVTRGNTGISLDNSSCNIFSANNIMNNIDCGVMLYNQSPGNTFAGNNIADNRYGICLGASCDNNRIYENNITGSSDCGIHLYYSSNNSIYHNSFADNTEHASVSPDSLAGNFWDDGYPSGGNYWSGYSDTDLYSGPYQNETGSDGIWDHPYVMNEENQDNYPTVPEYRASVMLLTPMILTLIMIAVHKRKKTGTTQSTLPPKRVKKAKLTSF